MPGSITVRTVRDRDFFEWYDLYCAYGDFYQSPTEGDGAVRVWSWLIDPAHETEALVAEQGGHLVGVAHIREFARPLAGSRGLYLDDLFVAPDARGSGVGYALLAGVRDLAAARGASVVRWITDAKNEQAQRLYDRVAQRTEWVTYDLTP